jgi:uncharacterized membrane protein
VTVWLAIRFLHELAMAFFVGGQLFLVVAVVPVHRGREDGELAAIARRFGDGTLAAGAVLLATGPVLASHFHQWGNSELHVKLALVALLVALVLWHLRAPRQRVLDGAIFLVSLAVVWVGIGLAH